IGRRRRLTLPASVLVLRPPRGLHHLHPWDRNRFDDHFHLFPPPCFRISGTSAFPRRYRLHWLRTLGPSHVRHWPAANGTELLHCGKHDDRNPLWCSDLLLDRNSLGRQASAQDAPLVLVRIFLRVRVGRPNRSHARARGARYPGARYLFRGCTFSLCPDRRCGVSIVRGTLLLVS